MRFLSVFNCFWKVFHFWKEATYHLECCKDKAARKCKPNASKLVSTYCVTQFPQHASIVRDYEELVKNRPKSSEDEKAEEAAGPKPSVEASA